MIMWIPPKYSISSVMGFLKGKLSLRLFQRYEQLGKKYWGRHLWSRGYCLTYNLFSGIRNESLHHSEATAIIKGQNVVKIQVANSFNI